LHPNQIEVRILLEILQRFLNREMNSSEKIEGVRSPDSENRNVVYTLTSEKRGSEPKNKIWQKEI